MKYFQTLPNVQQPDPNGNYIYATNIIARGYLLPKLQDNIYLFYKYNVKEFDKPEIISYKYYNDSYSYWKVMYANNIFDYQYDWVLDNKDFTTYILDKYAATAAKNNAETFSYVLATVHHYEMTITTSNNVDNEQQTITIEIDANTYTNLINTPIIQKQTFPGSTETVTKITDKKAISIYEYETNLNENKRQINLIKDQFSSDMDVQLASLMGR